MTDYKGRILQFPRFLPVSVTLEEMKCVRAHLGIPPTEGMLQMYKDYTLDASGPTLGNIVVTVRDVTPTSGSTWATGHATIAGTTEAAVTGDLYLGGSSGNIHSTHVAEALPTAVLSYTSTRTAEGTETSIEIDYDNLQGLSNWLSEYDKVYADPNNLWHHVFTAEEYLAIDCN